MVFTRWCGKEDIEVITARMQQECDEYGTESQLRSTHHYASGNTTKDYPTGGYTIRSKRMGRNPQYRA